MNIFEDLLQNTKGYPPEFYADLRNTADTLQAISALAKIDVVAETQHVLDHLPELRTERVQQMRLDAKDPHSWLTKADRERTLLTADRLEKSAEKLKAPDVDESFKRRAALVELSIYMKARLRETTHVTPELDPERLKKFNLAMGAITKSLPADVGTKVDRENMARMVFVQELRAAGGDVDLAVDNIYKEAFGDAERGHWGDAPLEGVLAAADNESVRNIVPGNQQTQDYVAKQILREDQAEHDADALHNDVLKAMPAIAAEYLNPKEYACYRTMIDNEHLMDWKIEKGKVRFKAKTLDATDPENTTGKILQRDLNYQNIRGANDLIKTTVERLNTLALEHAGEDVLLTEKGVERMGKFTQEIVSDPAAKARPAPTAGKPRKDKGKGKGI